MVAAGLPAFVPFNWIDIVDAAPIPLAFDLRATRHRQMIEQVRQRVFLTVESYYLCSAEHRLPLALAASNLNHRTGLVRKPIMGFPSRSLTITTIQVDHRHCRPAANETMLGLRRAVGTEVVHWLGANKPAYKLDPGFLEHPRLSPGPRRRG